MSTPTPQPPPQTPSDARHVVIIGGGPAGLAAAYQLTELSVAATVLEKRDKVGGIACTETYKGYAFDMGGHRFFTKVKEVEDVWRSVLGDAFLRRPRLSRIYYNRRFFYYPLRPFNALAGLGIVQAILVTLSYLRWQALPYRHEDTFEQWVTNRFGDRLYRTFFKTYTEKVWGIPCSELKAEWAAQRIKDLSFRTALVSMFVRPGRTIKTLIEEFDYPERGPGMLWNQVKTVVEARGATVRLNSDVTRLCRDGQRVRAVVVATPDGEVVLPASDVISSMPLSEAVQKLDPPPADDVLAAARALKYRDFLTVCVVVDQPDLFPDNWIYVHSPAVRVGRIQNFKNWSAAMTPDPSKTSLGLEYFCSEGDELWTMADDALIDLAARELERIGLARAADVEDGVVYRVPKSYPIYDSDYRDALATLRAYVDSLENFQTVGRNGMHRYNNQDHSMLTGMLAARRVALGEAVDLWSVNTDQEYHEEVKVLEKAVQNTFRKLDRVAFGGALGLATALCLAALTLLAWPIGGQAADVVGLLSEFFPGYAVSPLGSLIGAAYGFGAGFALGWLAATLRNTVLFLSVALVERGFERRLLSEVFDYM